MTQLVHADCHLVYQKLLLVVDKLGRVDVGLSDGPHFVVRQPLRVKGRDSSVVFRNFFKEGKVEVSPIGGASLDTKYSK